MKNRICIPIYDHQGNLVAYAGRAVEKEAEKVGVIFKCCGLNVKRKKRILWFEESFKIKQTSGGYAYEEMYKPQQYLSRRK